MAMRKETIRITKLLNGIYNDSKFLSDICSMSNNNYQAVLFALGDVLEYYITSRNTRTLTAEEMNVVIGLFKYIGTNKDYQVFNIKDNEEPISVLRRNILKDGYMTRSTNMCFLKRISKYGLGNELCIDKKLNKYLDYLEFIFGKSNYSVVDNMDYNQFCMSTPGANSFYHAGSNCPKRFFLGILGQSEQDILPIKVGELKIDYYRRVLEHKLLNTNLNKKGFKRALKVGEKALKILCKTSPCIILIPINSDNYSLKVTKKRNDDYNVMPINDWIFLKIMKENPMSFFSRDFGDANDDLGNIIAFKTVIPFSELGIIKVLDRFEIMQIIAKNKKYKRGTEFSYLTGEIIEKK